MDKSKFDDIIREKLESHVDPSGPSGSEVSRLFEELPKVTSQAVSLSSKIFVAASTILVITTVFLIYRTWRLEETVRLMELQLLESGESQTQTIYETDTLFWDSLESITRRVVKDQIRSQPQANIASPPMIQEPVNTPSQPLTLSPEDSQRFVNEVMAQLISTLESNPELMEQLIGKMKPNDPRQVEVSEDEQDEEWPAGSAEEVRTRIVKDLEKQDAINQILEQIANDPEKSPALINIISGNNASMASEDQLGILSGNDNNETEPIDIESIAEDRQAEILEEYMKSDPNTIIEISKELELDSVTVHRMEEYAVAENLEGRGLELDSISIARPELMTSEEVREEQEKVKDRSWWLGPGLGLGQVSLNELGSTTVQSFGGIVEYQPGSRFSIASGPELYMVNGEGYDTERIDFDEFEGLPNDIQNIAKEIKVNLTWLDIPLQARLYLFPGNKINPFLTVSVRARALMGEKYLIETTTDQDYEPSFEAGDKFIIPSFGYGIGGRVEFNPRLHGGLHIRHSIGGEELGLFENQYNTIQGQAFLLFRLDR